MSVKNNFAPKQVDMNVRSLSFHPRRFFPLSIVLLASLLCQPVGVQAQCPAGSVIYVRADAPAGGNGQTWTTAYNELQKAINSAAACTAQKQIWVAKGTYYPTEKPWNAASTDTRDLAFYLRNNLAIYGGFDGTETTLTARNPTANPTTLSGDIGTPGYNSDNCYHVLVNATTTNTTFLNGFTVTSGNANGSGNLSFVVGSATYQLSRTSGGGIYNTANAQVIFVNMAVVNNKALDFGGGIYNFNASPTVTNAVLSADSANYGGGMLNENAAPALAHITFCANNAISNGGAIRNYNASPTIRNSIIWGNTGGGMQSIYSSNGSDTARVFNCIVQGNPVYNGATNTNTNPQWRNPALPAGADGNWMTTDDGLQLLCGSPAINTATTEGGFATADILSTTRPQGNAYDRGAYEYIAMPPVVSITASTGFPTCAGASVIFTATGTDVGNAPVYQWYVNNIAAGTNSTSFTYTPGTSGDIVYAKLGNGCAIGTSNAITVSFLAPGGRKIYVDSSVTVSGNGASWSTAFKELREALPAAIRCNTVDTILIAKGTYYPAVTNRDSTFLITRSKLKLYGGYPSGGGNRNPAANSTILSGDINQLGEGYYDDSWHIMVAAGISNTADSLVLDGLSFIYSATYGSGADTYLYNGVSLLRKGALALTGNDTTMPVAVRNCTFSRNENNGIYNQSSRLFLSDCRFADHNNCVVNRECTVVMNRCSFLGNYAYSSDRACMYNYKASVQVSECTFTGNFSTALYNEFSKGSFSKCRFDSNGNSNNAYGGVQNRYSNMSYTGCSISANLSGNNAGGMVNLDSTTTITNCIFYANQCLYDGKAGALLNAGGNSSRGRTTVTNCTFFDNKGGLGGASVTTGQSSGSISFTNCILWRNSNDTLPAITNPNAYTSITVNNSIIQRGYPGIGNYTLDPLFTNATNPTGADGVPGTPDDGLTLQPCSIGINTGNVAALLAGVSTDITGAPRVQEIIDMGAYERAAASVPNKIYVDSSRTVSGNGDSWSTAFNNLQDALYYTNNCYRVDTILIAKGTYYPAVTNRDSTFLITRSKLKLYGGYPSGGGNRNPAANSTILSGDINQPGEGYYDNSWHIMVAAGISNMADSLVLDGLTFIYSATYGGGADTYLYNGVSLLRKGALALTGNDTAMPVAVRNCIFFRNDNNGIYNQSSRLYLADCRFMDYHNGVVNREAAIIMKRCLFSGNYAYSRGQGLYVQL